MKSVKTVNSFLINIFMGLLEPRKTTGNLNSTDFIREIKFRCLGGCSYLQKTFKDTFLYFF